MPLSSVHKDRQPTMIWTLTGGASHFYQVKRASEIKYIQLSIKNYMCAYTHTLHVYSDMTKYIT